MSMKRMQGVNRSRMLLGSLVFLGLLGTSHGARAWNGHAPRIKTGPALSGAAVAGGALQTSTGVWSGVQPSRYSYRWKRCTADGTSCSPVKGARAAVHPLTTKDVGSRLYAVVTARNSAGRKSARTSLSRLVAAPAPSREPAAPPAPGPWTLKWRDEFNRATLNRHKWRPNWLAGSDTAITKPVNGDESACYDPSQVSEGHGVLTLSAVQRRCSANNGVTYSYASGLVESNHHYRFTYGYMEARMRVQVNSSGTPVDWPAFWADGTGTWPTTGEIDTMEVLGGGTFCWHFHYPEGAPGRCPSVADAGDWHVFAADWEPGSITYYYDGVRVGRVTSGVTSAPMYLILNLAISTEHGGPLAVPAKMDVDYVRVWQHG